MRVIKNLFIILMTTQGAFWIAVSIFLLITRSQNPYIAALMLGNGFVFLASILVYNRNGFLKAAVIGFIALNLVLTLTDQTGIYDYIVLVLNIASLTSLIYLTIKEGQNKA